MEIWKDVPWCPDFYQVSDMGNVRSKDRVYPRESGGVTKTRGANIRLHDNDGYKRARLNVPGFSKWHTVHKLVMETFVGPRPDGLVIAHSDGDKTNNSLDNLSYKTNAENQADRIRHGTWHSDFDRPLSDKQIIAIREERAAGATLLLLSEKYSIDKTNVSQICLGKSYLDVAGPILKHHEVQAHRKLSDEQIIEIIKRRHAGEKIVPLGKEYGVCHSYVSKLYKEWFDENRIS